MKKKAFYLASTGILLAVGAYLWFSYGETESPAHRHEHEIADAHDHEEHEEISRINLNTEQIKEFGIAIEEAGPGAITQTLSAHGKILVHPDKLAHILPKVSGVAKEAFKNIGDHVKKGEKLAVLESREIAEIKANFLAAMEKEHLTLKLLEREQRLHDKQISAGEDYINAKSTYEEALINTRVARQKLFALGFQSQEIDQLSNQNDPDLRIYEIKAPIDGAIINRHLTKGEYIENTSTIFEIADLSSVWVEIGIYPKDLNKIKEGQFIDVTMPVEGFASKAKVIFISPIIQHETIMSKAVAELQNPEGTWRPGSYVQVEVPAENIASPIVVPKNAIQEINGTLYVFVKIPEGFEKRSIQTGISDNKGVAVLSGINVGELVAINNTFLLKADLGKSEVEHED